MQGVGGVGGADSAGGVGPGGDPVGGEGEVPAQSLFDAVVAPAEAEQVGVVGGSVGPGPDVVDVAEDGGDGAAGEAASPVAGLDPRGRPLRGPVGPGAASADGCCRALAGTRVARTRPTGGDGRRVTRVGGLAGPGGRDVMGAPRGGGVRGGVVEQGAGGRVATGHLHGVLAGGAGLLDGGGEPAAGDMDGLGAVGSGDLDQVAVTRSAGLTRVSALVQIALACVAGRDRLAVLAQATFVHPDRVSRAVRDGGHRLEGGGFGEGGGGDGDGDGWCRWWRCR